MIIPDTTTDSSDASTPQSVSSPTGPSAADELETHVWILEAFASDTSTPPLSIGILSHAVYPLNMDR
jgi:hypothetical protein